MRISLIFVFFTALVAYPGTDEAVAQWVQTNGPYGGSVQCFTVSGTNLFVGTWGGCVWRRLFSETTTSVERISSDLQKSLALHQNYPNPFNPSTEIQFSLPHRSNITLKIFDVVGREIARLVSGNLYAGTYSTRWDAAGFPSGVYLYRIQTEQSMETKKLVLVR